jgi:tetratricopeptide (TPR) repeat protein
LNFQRLTYLVLITWGALVVFPAYSFSQKELKKAEILYKNGKFCEAIPFFSRHLNAFADKDALVKRGWSYYHCNQLEEAIQDFEDARVLNYASSDLDYYLAKTFQQKHEFDTAISHFKKYLAAQLNDDDLRKLITDEIKRCALAIEMQYSPATANVENMGTGVNGKGNEINMIQSPQDPGRYYFSKSSAVEPSVYGIMVYTLREADWLKAEHLNPDHAQFNEVLVDIRPDGQVLFFSRYNEKSKKNKLLTDRFVPDDPPLSNIRFFEGPVDYESGDRDLFCINDSLFLFSSDRLPGYGGFDLYVTGYSAGYWFEPVNLGSTINTAYDEITPALSKNNTTLFFSSDRPNSIGGFDIFQSHFDSASLNWTSPVNLGLPVNSAGDDINYKPGSSGKGALITSNRKTAGYGGFDIYQVNHLVDTDAPPRLTLLDFLATKNLKKAYRMNGVGEQDLAVSKKDSLIQLPGRQSDTLPEFDEKLQEVVDRTTDPGVNTDSMVSVTGQITIRPLYYQADGGILEYDNQKDYIRSIIETLYIHPGLSIKMTAHCSPGYSAWHDLHRSLNNLLPVVKWMADEGIPPDHIFIASAGSSLPVARTQVPDRLKNASNRFNNRIQFSFSGKEADAIALEQAFVVQHLREDSWYLYQSIEAGLAYKIEVPVTSEEEYHAISRFLPFCLAQMDIFTTKTRYFFGIFTRFAQANEAAEKIAAETGQNARVVPFVEENEVDEGNVLEYARTHTDLVNFMQFNKR